MGRNDARPGFKYGNSNRSPLSFNGKVYTKGDKKSKKDMTDKIVICDEDGQEVTFELPILRRYLVKMRELADTPTVQLQEGPKLMFNKLIELFSMVSKTEFKDVVKNEVDAVFYDYDTLKPGTVGAFIAGCHGKPSNWPYEKPCDPQCASPFCEYANKCQHLVILYDKNRNFYTLNDADPTSTYIIIVDNNNFNGFTQDEINQLKKNNIKQVKIVLSSDGRYQEYLDYMNIDSIEPITNRNNRDNTGTNTGNRNGNGNGNGGTKNTNYQGWWWALAVVIILLILAVIGWYLYANGMINM